MGGTGVGVDRTLVGTITGTAVAGTIVSVGTTVGSLVWVIVGSIVYDGVKVSLFGNIVTTICGKIERFSV